jgi:hypothetical protein
MAGQTTHYAFEPRGEYVFGIVAGKPMRSCRGREHRLIQPGQLVAWDPSNAHTGAAVDGQPWTSRLIIIEIADLAGLAGDEESALLADVVFPEPALSDRQLGPRLRAAAQSGRAAQKRDSSTTSGSLSGCAR